MAFTDDDIKRLEDIGDEIYNLKDDYKKLDNEPDNVSNEINNMRKDIFDVQQKTKQPHEKRQKMPDIDQKRIDNGKAPRYVIQDNERLFKEPPTKEEKYKVGRVKYVKKDEDALSYPVPGELGKTGPKTMVCATLFVDFNDGFFSKLTGGNLEFAPTDVPFPELPSLEKYHLDRCVRLK